MKKIIIIALCIITVFAFASCTRNNTSLDNETNTGDTGDTGMSTELPNPLVSCATLDEASDVADFEIVAPDTITGYENITIEAIEDELIQVIYKDSGDNEIRIRKGVGNEDISGDYTEYAETSTIDVDGIQVTVKGCCSKINLATWTNDGSSYSIAITSSMSSDELTELIQDVQ